MEPSKEESNFEFVVSTPSHNALHQKDTKSFVRRYVMRTYKKKGNRSKTMQLKGDALTEYLARRHFQENTGSAALLGASRPNPFGRYLINMGSKEHELVHHIWASRQTVFQPFRDYWFLLGMMDPAAMHLIIANAAVHRKSLRNIRDDDIIDLTHTDKAIRSINERIALSGQNVTDEILGAVLGLMCHDFLAMMIDQCLFHLDGFQRMIELRGGLSSVDHSQPVRMSIYWIEHNICAATDMVPRFPPPFHLLKSPYSATALVDGLQHQEKIFVLNSNSAYFASGLLKVLTGLSILTVAWRDQTLLDMPVEHPNFPGFAFYPVMYKLLEIQTHQDEDETKQAVQEMCRLGGLFFLAVLRKSLGVSPVLTTVQMKKLKSLLATNKLLWEARFDTIRTWTIVMAACATVDAQVLEWAAEALRHKKSSKNIAWDEVHEMVSKMWWIEDVFASKAEEVKRVFTRFSIAK